MTFGELVSFAKLFSIALGLDRTMTMSKAELESACETLKIMADERNDWNMWQKELYKAMVDSAKAQTEGHTNG